MPLALLLLKTWMWSASKQPLIRKSRRSGQTPTVRNKKFFVSWRCGPPKSLHFLALDLRSKIGIERNDNTRKPSERLSHEQIPCNLIKRRSIDDGRSNSASRKNKCGRTIWIIGTTTINIVLHCTRLDTLQRKTTTIHLLWRNLDNVIVLGIGSSRESPSQADRRRMW